MTGSLIYKGNLRCENLHLQSGSLVETDAPTDNMGKGEKFSPTDLVCAALASCIVTTMAIKANSMQIELRGMKADYQKIMQQTPRKIAKIVVELTWPVDLVISEKDKDLLKSVAAFCPVHKALDGNVEMEIKFNH